METTLRCLFVYYYKSSRIKKIQEKKTELTNRYVVLLSYADFSEFIRRHSIKFRFQLNRIENE